MVKCARKDQKQWFRKTTFQPHDSFGVSVIFSREKKMRQNLHYWHWLHIAIFTSVLCRCMPTYFSDGATNCFLMHFRQSAAASFRSIFFLFQISNNWNMFGVRRLHIFPFHYLGGSMDWMIRFIINTQHLITPCASMIRLNHVGMLKLDGHLKAVVMNKMRFLH